MNKLFAILITSLLTYSCYSPIEIKGFDQTSWKKDKNACSNIRKDLYKDILDNRDALYSTSQQQIEALLGKPDRVALDQRSQKSFYYFITPSEKCSSDTQKNIEAIVIEFTPLSQVKFVTHKTFGI